jgi:hypothetical protein
MFKLPIVSPSTALAASIQVRCACDENKIPTFKFQYQGFPYIDISTKEVEKCNHGSSKTFQCP